MNFLIKIPSLKLKNTTIILLIAICLAFFVGILVGSGSYILIVALMSLIPACIVLKRPDISLALLAAFTLLIAGTIKYFLGLGQFQWILSGLGVLLLAYAALQHTFTPFIATSEDPGFLALIGLWWAILLFGSAANNLPMLDWLVGVRIYLPVFGVFAYIAYCYPSERLLKGILFFMLTVGSVQWVFCIYQKLLIVPLRLAGHYPGSAWDSIVGTFGGDKFGGGESGSLGVYLSLMATLAIALHKQEQLKTFWFFLIFVSSFAAMAMVESKIIALMIPAGFFLVYREYAFKKPIAFISGSIAVAILMACLLIAYFYLYWQTDDNKGLLDALYDRFAYSFDPKFQPSTTNLGRVKSLVFWWDRHALLDNPLTILFGHGLASAVSSSSIIGTGVAVRAQAVMLDVTGISKLLWETGVVGSLVFISIFVLGFFRARKLKSNSALPPWHRAAMTGVEAAFALMPFTIFYEVTIVSSPPMQFAAMFFLGYVAYWWRENHHTTYG